jgi:hypothetical protein
MDASEMAAIREMMVESMALLERRCSIYAGSH